MSTNEKPVRFAGSSHEDLKSFSKKVTDEVGYALYKAQVGSQLRSKPLKGFGGANVWEIISHDEGGTYRVVYTIRFPKAIFVLHCFQKKSKHGIKTPLQEINLLKQRLREAELKYKNEFC